MELRTAIALGSNKLSQYTHGQHTLGQQMLMFLGCTTRPRISTNWFVLSFHVLFHRRVSVDRREAYEGGTYVPFNCVTGRNRPTRPTSMGSPRQNFALQPGTQSVCGPLSHAGTINTCVVCRLRQSLRGASGKFCRTTTTPASGPRRSQPQAKRQVRLMTAKWRRK